MRKGLRNRFLAWCLCGIAASGAILSGASAFAEDFSWLNYNGANWINPQVEDQVWWGGCYSFSNNSVLEAKYMATRNDSSFVPDLSEQQMYCVEQEIGSQGMGYAISHGIVSETEVPYTLTYPTAGWPLATGWENRVWKATSIVATPATTVQQLKDFLKSYGPFQTGFSADDGFYEPAGGFAGGAHAVEVYGFHDDPTVPGGGYWLIKNSWGPAWNGNGYGKIAYADGAQVNTSGLFLDGPVYYTGTMYHTGAYYPGTNGTDYTGTAAINTWKGLTSATWDTSSGTANNWRNSSTSAAFQWINQELQANFDSTGTNKAISVNGKVIAHGLNITASGYSFAPVNGGSITVTSGGITTNNSVSFSTPIYVGGPQTWNITSGKTITVSGALHTVISNLTVAGAGNVTISGAIDGGGMINNVADGGTVAGTLGTKPGGLIKNNTGTMTLTGVSNFGGDITVNTGTLSLNPSASSTYRGAFFGSGTLSLGPTSAATISIGGGNSNYTGPISIGSNATLAFVPTAGVLGTFSGRISGTSRPVIQNGPGTTRLTGANTYTGSTTIQNGALQANSGAGLPSSSMLILKGGVLQGEGTVTFTRTLSSTAGSNRFYWASGTSGGFAAGSGNMNVRINNGTSTISFGGVVGSTIQGSLILSSSTSNGVTTFENGLNLNGSYSGIIVNDNPNSTVDYAIISGNIINSSGTAGFTKSGDGLLYLPGTNTYNGNTILGGGALLGDFGTGIPTNTTMVLMGGVFQPLNATSITRNIGIGSGQICWNTSAAGGGFAAHTNNINVNLFGDSRMISWGTDQSQNIIGPLKFNNVFSVGSVSFANSLNLAGGARTIQVDGTVADLSGAISGGSGSSLTKTGVATLTLSGTASNTYSGQTILKDGALNLNKTNAIAVPGDLIFDGTTASVVRLIRSNQLSSTSNVIWNDSTSSNYHYLEILGNTQTVASISNRTGFSIIENTESETGIGNGVLTVQNSTDCFYKGWMRNSNNGSGTLGLTKAGAGTLTLASCWYEGWGGYSYTGTTTISAGKLLLQDVNGFASPVVNNSALELRSSKAGLTFGQPISGTGSLSVSSDTTSGVVFLSNSTSNTYAGNTTLRGGGLVLNTTGGAIAIPGNLTITDAGNGYQTFVGLFAPNQFAATSSITFNGSAPGTTSFYMYGNAQTLAGINDSSGNALIGNGSADTPCTLTLSNCNSSYGGIITDYGPAPLSLVKTGGGQLTLNGTGVINLTGGITVNGGVLYLAKTSGVAVPGVLNMTATSGTSWVVVQGNNQLSTNATLNFPVGNYPYYPHFLLAGYNVTVAGISDSTGTGVIENMEDTAANTATLTINNSTNSFFNGFLRNAYSGNAPLAVIKNGAGTLTLSGNYANDFTGGLTINAGTVDFENTENDVAHPYTVNAGGHLVLNGVQLAAAASAMSLIAASETEDYANAVPDTNNGTMSIVGSTYFNARNLVGTGTLMVKDDAVVYAHSLVQDTLVIGGTSSYSPAVAVPEPGTMILLSLGVMALAGVGIGRKNRG